MVTDDKQRAATDAIIDAFGGISPLARAMGHKNPSTVQGWKKRGIIPIRQWPAVLDAALRLGLPAPNFLEPPAPLVGENPGKAQRAA